MPEESVGDGGRGVHGRRLAGIGTLPGELATLSGDGPLAVRGSIFCNHALPQCEPLVHGPRRYDTA
jgi:hypothetical protein